jgi:hypothetical protein
VPTIIDSLIVTLGLDSAGFEKGSRQSREAVNRTKADALLAGKDMEAAGKRGAQFFSQMRNEASWARLRIPDDSELTSASRPNV